MERNPRPLAGGKATTRRWTCATRSVSRPSIVSLYWEARPHLRRWKVTRRRVGRGPKLPAHKSRTVFRACVRHPRCRVRLVLKPGQIRDERQFRPCSFLEQKRKAWRRLRQIRARPTMPPPNVLAQALTPWQGQTHHGHVLFLGGQLGAVVARPPACSRIA